MRVYFEIRMLVSSRVFGLEPIGGHTVGIVPYADMFNHNLEKKNAKYSFD